MSATRKKNTGVSANYFTGPIRTLFSGSSSIKLNDSSLLVDADSGSATLTLPTAIGHAGAMFWIKRIDDSTNTVTLQTVLGQAIDGVSSIRLIRQNDPLLVMSDGTNWQLYVNQSRTVDQQWSFPGTLAADQNTNLFVVQVRRPSRYVAFDAKVVVAPTGLPIFVDWAINGVIDATLRVTIEEGDTYGEKVIDRVLAIDETIQAQVSQVGNQQPGQTLFMRARGG